MSLTIKTYVALFFLCFCSLAGFAQGDKPISISNTNSPAAFPLVKGGQGTVVYIDKDEAAVVHIAATCFSSDVKKVTGALEPVQVKDAPTGFAIIGGTIGNSKLIDKLIRDHQINVDKVQGLWETF